MRLLTGILAPDAGTVQVLGRDQQTEGQAAGLMVLSPLLLAAGSAVCWAIALVVLRLGTRAVSRTRLGERL